MTTFKIKTLFILIGFVNYIQLTSTQQTCGILHDNGSLLPPADKNNPIVSDPFFADDDVNFTIWEKETRNVTGAAATDHPHYRYISGLRYTKHYKYFVNDKTIEFLNVYSSPILREVKYTCADGSSVTYNFKFPILPADSEQPSFHQASYSFTITPEWPLSRPINFNSFIVVMDNDKEMINAVLEFGMSEMSSSLSSFDVTVEATGLWDPTNNTSLLAYRLDLFLTNISPTQGDYSGILTARSRKQTKTVSISIKVA